jgi:hypothetical protein
MVLFAGSADDVVDYLGKKTPGHSFDLIEFFASTLYEKVRKRAVNRRPVDLILLVTNRLADDKTISLLLTVLKIDPVTANIPVGVLHPEDDGEIILDEEDEDDDGSVAAVVQRYLRNHPQKRN